MRLASTVRGCERSIIWSMRALKKSSVGMDLASVTIFEGFNPRACVRRDGVHLLGVVHDHVVSIHVPA